MTEVTKIPDRVHRMKKYPEAGLEESRIILLTGVLAVIVGLAPLGQAIGFNRELIASIAGINIKDPIDPHSPPGPLPQKADDDLYKEYYNVMEEYTEFSSGLRGGLEGIPARIREGR